MAPEASRGRDSGAMDTKLIIHELGMYAKVICSALFVSKRDFTDAWRNSGPAPEIRDQIAFKVDWSEERVAMTYKGHTRVAKYIGDQGCIILPQNSEQLFFTPVPVQTQLPDASTLPWPMGDLLDKSPSPTGLDPQEIGKAMNLAFEDPLALTAAVVVVHKGKIIGERYCDGIHKDTQLESWSMGKSLLATLFSFFIKDGTYSLEQRAPIPQWSSLSDPRRNILIADLLRMSSGLQFSASFDRPAEEDNQPDDHAEIYREAMNSADFCLSRPLIESPKPRGRYRNCDPVVIGWLIREALKKRGVDYHTFPQRVLFDRIGIRRQVLETDLYGNFLLTGYDYGTARNWARLGLLYAQNGAWEGEQLLSKEWVDFVRTPAPEWDPPAYGGLFHLNKTGQWPVPNSAYGMVGKGAQYTIVIPSHELVVVRMGHTQGEISGGAALKKMLGRLMEVIPKS